MRLPETKIDFHKISQPISLLAVGLFCLIICDIIFIYVAKNIKEPCWIPVVFVILAGILPIIGFVMFFVMLTKYRKMLLGDDKYLEYSRWEAEEFKDFNPENTQVKFKDEPDIEKDEEWEDREKRRVRRYQNNYGLFLIHTWRPSKIPNQVADIAISLHAHGEGTLKYDLKQIKSVEYHLGPMFFNYPVVKTNSANNFRLNVSAYGPMLCLARVIFKDGRQPLDLERYINF